jgi:hypothetical protein
MLDDPDESREAVLQLCGVIKGGGRREMEVLKPVEERVEEVVDLVVIEREEDGVRAAWEVRRERRCLPEADLQEVELDGWEVGLEQDEAVGRGIVHFARGREGLEGGKKRGEEEGLRCARSRNDPVEGESNEVGEREGGKGGNPGVGEDEVMNFCTGRTPAPVVGFGYGRERTYGSEERY